MTEKKNKLQGKSIVITGAAGLLARAAAEKLNSLGETKLILVDAKEKANHPKFPQIKNIRTISIGRFF